MNRNEIERAHRAPAGAVAERLRPIAYLTIQAEAIITPAVQYMTHSVDPALKLIRAAQSNMAETSYRLPTSLSFHNHDAAKMRDDLAAARENLSEAVSASARRVFQALIARITARIARLELLTSVAPIESARDLEPAWVAFELERSDHVHDGLRRVPLGCPPPRALVHAPGAPFARVLA